MSWLVRLKVRPWNPKSKGTIQCAPKFSTTLVCIIFSISDFFTKLFSWIFKMRHPVYWVIHFFRVKIHLRHRVPMIDFEFIIFYVNWILHARAYIEFERCVKKSFAISGKSVYREGGGRFSQKIIFYVEPVTALPESRENFQISAFTAVCLKSKHKHFSRSTRGRNFLLYSTYYLHKFF